MKNEIPYLFLRFQYPQIWRTLPVVGKELIKLLMLYRDASSETFMLNLGKNEKTREEFQDENIEC